MSRSISNVAARNTNSYWPETRIKRRGLATTQSLKMRSFLKSSAVYLVVFFVFCLGYIYTRVQVVEMGYRLKHLEDVQEKMKEENRSLMVEAATLRSPQRLEKIAATLGLKRPSENQIIYLKRE